MKEAARARRLAAERERANLEPESTITGLGAAAGLGTIMRYGAVPMATAFQACKRGEATPEQQMMVADLLEAVSGR